MADSGEERLIEYIRGELAAARLGSLTIVHSVYDEPHFGNGGVWAYLAPLILRFTLDRSQWLLDLASEVEPVRFHMFVDVDIAMGWVSPEIVYARTAFETISVELPKIQANLEQLREAFARPNWIATRQRIEEASRLRGETNAARYERQH